MPQGHLSEQKQSYQRKEYSSLITPSLSFLFLFQVILIFIHGNYFHFKCHIGVLETAILRTLPFICSFVRVFNFINKFFMWHYINLPAQSWNPELMDNIF